MLDIMLEEFPFSSLWNSGIFLFLAFSAVIYLFILPQEKKHPFWKSAVFFIGLVVIFFSAASPLNIIGRIQFSAHIVQIVLLVFIAPPLLIIGMKRRILVQAFKIKILAKIFDFITKPVVTIGLFFLALYGYHHPPIFDQARVDLYGNYLYLFILFLTAILLWVPILSKKNTKKMLTIYHLICMAFILPLGGILLLSKEILYQAYTDLTTFTQALEVCLPTGQTLSPELVLLLLPFEPIGEQYTGGIIWVVAGLVIFSISLLVNRIIVK
ncbi:cytochrome c oxidase assembly protein [Paucisalibacillus globulus]|uniref:cytochrome c oxidase assembly protein n=1 Tax=Paucisalibacillus globulus TaxID=351095 RepID=UPI000BB6F7A9|nr:cytochrome c oxidase assembly protein [Paucisalibacillus globulus]